MTGRLVDISFSLNRKQRITLEVDSDFRSLWDKLHLEPVLDVEIKKHRKKAAHAAFDPLWKYGPYRGRRNEAYRWLSEKMGTPIEFTHIGMFDVDQCRKVVRIMREERNQLWKI